MIRKFFKNNIFIIFAIAFLFPVIIIVFNILNHDNYNYDDILKYGIETDAYVISGTQSSNVSVNGTSYYSIQYSFYDDNMVVHTGITSQSYTYNEINKMIENEVIKIKYLPDTYKSIESFYDSSQDKGKNSIIIFTVFFGIADLILWFIAIRIGCNNLLNDKIEKYGREFDANVIKISSNVIINGVHKYKVHYSWVNEMYKQIVSVSKSIYYYDEAQALEKEKHIRIKAIGKKSVIITKPNVEILTHTFSNELQEKISTTCRYCGNSISNDQQYCTNCGAKIINNDK